jgi:hypothetical protein
MNRVLTTIILFCLAAASQTALAANSPSQHLDFNGFFAGMSKAAAKKLGMGACHRANLRAYVTFDYSASLGRARANAGKNAAKKKELANF